MSGNFLSCTKGVKDPFDVQEGRCEFPIDATAEKGLISPGGENLLDFLEMWQVLSTYDRDLRDPLWWPLKEINPGISLEGMMLKLKLQFFGHLMQRVDSLEKTLMLEGIVGRRRRGRQRMR